MLCKLQKYFHYRNNTKCVKQPVLEHIHLDIQQIDANFDLGFVCLSVGKKFGNRKIRVYATLNGDNTTIVKNCRTFTTKCGHFKINFPQNIITEVLVTVKIKYKKYYLSTSGSYYPYSQQYNLSWRSYTGTSNNLIRPEWGSIGIPLLKISYADYKDGVSEIQTSRPNPRIISNAICTKTELNPNKLNLTDLVWTWGQFIDHTLALTKSNDAEPVNIITPSLTEDESEQYPNRTIIFNRSKEVDKQWKTAIHRQHGNSISAYIDASTVYGYSDQRAYVLRLLDGSGKMKTQINDNDEILLPFNIYGLENDSHNPHAPPESLYIAGDIRVNENVLLIAMHTLFIREHNRLCDVIIQNNPELSGIDELIYQQAKRILTGIIQSITYNEFLPALLGPNYNLDTYDGYDSKINVSIADEFTTAGYRIGHGMLSPTLKIGDTTNEVKLRDVFFTPSYVQTNGINELLLGASLKKMQEINGQVVDDVRNFLFGPPTANMILDLASLNIQRGRDHGLPNYNDVREAYGLARLSSFTQVTSNISVSSNLTTLYETPDNMDTWIGVMVEDHVDGGAVGELCATIIRDQFYRLRKGDRYYFENDQILSVQLKQSIRTTLLSDVITRNTNINVNNDVFHVS